MSSLYLDVRPTRAYAGLILHRILVSPVSLLVYGALIAPLVWQSMTMAQYELAFILVALVLFGIHIEQSFIQRKLVRDEEPVLSRDNLGCFLAYEVIAHLPGKSHVTVSRLLKAACSTRRAQKIFSLLNTSKRDVLRATKGSVDSQEDVMKFIGEAVKAAREIGEQRIDANALLAVFFKRSGAFEDILNQSDVSHSDLKEILHWESFYHQLEVSRLEHKAQDLSRKLGSLGRGLVQGYTSELDELTTDISRQAVWRSAERGVLIHDTQIKHAIHTLGRASEHNLLVVGDPGVGKRTFVENVAAQLRRQEKRSGSAFTRVLILKTEELLSGREEADKTFLGALKTAEESGKVLLIVPNLATFITAADPQLKTVFSKFLQSKTISILGMLTPEQYHQHVKTDPVLDTQMQKVQLESTDEEETMAVLMMKVFMQTSRRPVHVPYSVLNVLHQLTKRYIGKGAFPGKATDVLDDALALASKSRKRTLTETHVRKAVSLQASIDVSDLSTGERDKLIHLEEVLKASIIGQDKAVEALVHTLKRARLDISAGKRPLGTFLFLGPTGVGKTHTAKILAQEYFGSTDALIRLDMNEYGHEDSVVGLIGDPSPAAGTDAFLTKQVQDRPFSLILLDEIEKAHPKVLNLFLQILDEGRLADSRGTVTDFRNTIIISTSNAGALFIRDFIKDNQTASKEAFKEALIEQILKDRAFAPEFINRFDEVILYYPMSIKDAIKVALLMLQGIVVDIAEKKGYHIEVEDDVVVEIVSRGYSIEFGAREMRRTIMGIIENFLADHLLKNDLKRGDTIRITMSDITEFL